jgi:hypothetical protein
MNNKQYATNHVGETILKKSTLEKEWDESIRFVSSSKDTEWTKKIINAMNALKHQKIKVF